MESKKCTKCNETKLVSEFHKTKRHSTGYTSECKLCRKIQRRVYQTANRDIINERYRKYIADNLEHFQSYRIKYNAENAKAISERQSRWYSDNRERVLENQKEYNINNRHIQNAASAKRRAKKALQTPESACLTTISTIYKNCPKGYHVDHIKPLARGGAHHQDNLCYLPAAFNISKSDKLLSEHPELNAQFNELAIFPNV